MPLDSIIAAVQKSRRTQQVVQQQERYNPSKPIPNLIDASDQQFIKTPPKPFKQSLSTSINAIAKELELKNSLNVVSNTQVSWESCKCLKRSAEKLFCTKFFSLCAKDSCPKRYIEM